MSQNMHLFFKDFPNSTFIVYCYLFPFSIGWLGFYPQWEAEWISCHFNWRKKCLAWRIQNLPWTCGSKTLSWSHEQWTVHMDRWNFALTMEPDNYKGLEFCLLMYERNKWNDQKCNNHYGEQINFHVTIDTFVCQCDLKWIVKCSFSR